MWILLIIISLYTFYTWQDNQKKIKELEAEIEQLQNQIMQDNQNNN